MDISMPILDGYQASIMIRELEKQHLTVRKETCVNFYSYLINWRILLVWPHTRLTPTNSNVSNREWISIVSLTELYYIPTTYLVPKPVEEKTLFNSLTKLRIVILRDLDNEDSDELVHKEWFFL